MKIYLAFRRIHLCLENQIILQLDLKRNQNKTEPFTRKELDLLDRTIKSSDFEIRGARPFPRVLFTNQIFPKRSLSDLCNVIWLDLRTGVEPNGQ